MSERQLEKILGLRQMEQRRLANALEEASNEWADSNARAEEIEQMVDDYHESLSSVRTTAGTTIANERRFFAQMLSARQIQQQQREIAAHQLEARRTQFVASRGRTHLLEELIKKRALDHEKRTEKKRLREQVVRQRTSLKLA